MNEMFQDPICIGHRDRTFKPLVSAANPDWILQYYPGVCTVYLPSFMSEICFLQVCKRGKRPSAVSTQSLISFPELILIPWNVWSFTLSGINSQDKDIKRFPCECQLYLQIYSHVQLLVRPAILKGGSVFRVVYQDWLICRELCLSAYLHLAFNHAYYIIPPGKPAISTHYSGWQKAFLKAHTSKQKAFITPQSSWRADSPSSLLCWRVILTVGHHSSLLVSWYDWVIKR